MKIAKEKVWLNDKGELVKDGDASAVSLVARAGQQVPDQSVSEFKNAKQFFKDAVFDSDAKLVVEPVKGESPAPENREDDAAKKLHKR